MHGILLSVWVQIVECSLLYPDQSNLFFFLGLSDTLMNIRKLSDVFQLGRCGMGELHIAGLISGTARHQSKWTAGCVLVEGREIVGISTNRVQVDILRGNSVVVRQYSGGRIWPTDTQINSRIGITQSCYDSKLMELYCRVCSSETREFRTRQILSVVKSSRHSRRLIQPLYQ